MQHTVLTERSPDIAYVLRSIRRAMSDKLNGYLQMLNLWVYHYDVTQWQVLPNGDLVIHHIDWPNMGVYYCKVQNNAGSDVVDMFVYPVGITIVLICSDIFFANVW